MIDERIAAAIRERVDEQGKLACAAAFRIARELEVEPLAVGKTADRLDVRLNRCQLGLFGYGPKERGEHKIVEPASEVDPALSQAMQERVHDGRLSCEVAWEIAAGMRIPKMKVSAAAETLGIKIVDCQLGAF